MNLLERYCLSTGNVVVRDETGKPSIFVRHPKVQSSFFSASLPNHTHPAFIVNGVEDPAILIGKYANSELTTGGHLYSLPNAVPNRTSESITSMISRTRSVSGNISCMTIADHGFLVLMAQKYPDKMALLRGNTGFCDSGGYYGGSADTSRMYRFGQSMTAGRTYVYAGVAYKCLVSHTSSKQLLPTNTPAYWEKLDRVGGVWAGYLYDTSDATYGGLPTVSLTGSGPIDWYLFSDISMEADLLTNTQSFLAGIMLNGAEINILPDNNAADPLSDLSPNSSAWRAIVPNSNSAKGYDLVTPGSADNTLKLAWINSRATYIARAITNSEYKGSNFFTDYANVAIDDSVSIVPPILYELGLLPLPGKTIKGSYNFMCSAGTKRFILCGLGAVNVGSAPTFTLWSTATSNNVTDSRSRAREIATA